MEQNRLKKEHNEQEKISEPPLLPDLPPFFRWVLRLVFVALIIVPLGITSTRITVHFLKPTIHYSEPASVFEADLPYFYIDAAWLNDREILLLGFPESPQKNNDVEFRVFDTETQKWRILNRVQMDCDLHNPFHDLLSGDTIFMRLQDGRVGMKLFCYKDQVLLLEPQVDGNQLTFKSITQFPRQGCEQRGIYANYISPDLVNRFSPVFSIRSDNIQFVLEATGSSSCQRNTASPPVTLDYESVVAWSNSGESIALSSQRSGSNSLDPTEYITLMDAQSLESEILLKRVYDIAYLEWLKSDEELFFTGEIWDEDGAWILDIETAELWFLYGLSDPGYIRAASLSPSARYFFAQQNDRDGSSPSRYELVIVELPPR